MKKELFGQVGGRGDARSPFVKTQKSQRQTGNKEILFRKVESESIVSSRPRPLFSSFKKSAVRGWAPGGATMNSPLVRRIEKRHQNELISLTPFFFFFF